MDKPYTTRLLIPSHASNMHTRPKRLAALVYTSTNVW